MSHLFRTLISVSDKTGVVEFATALIESGAAIISTGGTASVLSNAGIAVTSVSNVTGFPEIMDGRVKTLHPKIHGALLGRRDIDDEVMAEHGIELIDILVVNLYPFEKTVAAPDSSYEDAIENIDIGGPAMIRAAAKNHDRVAVIVDPGDYEQVIHELNSSGGLLSDKMRRELAVKAFAHTANYDAAIADYLNARQDGGDFPDHLAIGLRKVSELRYGENPHQRAALYSAGRSRSGTVIAARQVQGKPLSFNNIADADAALGCVKELDAPGCVIVKHANPCGVALGSTAGEAYDRAYATDPESAFGGIIAFNRPVDGETAREILERQFAEVIVAPSFEEAAFDAFSSKPNLRVLETGEWESVVQEGQRLQQIEGGVLRQDIDTGNVSRSDLRIVTRRQPTDQQIDDALLAWKVVKFVKSNAIVHCKDGATVGIGAGQMSRVMSVKIAGLKADAANLDLHGAAMASDAFFPFRDAVDAAAPAGTAVIIQPGGSVRDEEVISAADEHDIAMLFTGMRHFRH